MPPLATEANRGIRRECADDAHFYEVLTLHNGRVRIPSRSAIALVMLGLALPVAGAAPSHAASRPVIRLAIHVDVGDGRTHDYTLRCNPNRSSRHPNAAAACALLNRSGRAVFAPTPKGAMCTMIYGGPQRARVTGSWGKIRINARFSRENGCEVTRWNRAIPLLGMPQPTPSPTPSPALYTLTGHVSLGPTCPVQQVGQTCTRPSVDAPVTFTRYGSDTVTAQATEASGFSVRLRAGTWSATARAGMRCPVVEVTVPATKDITIPCDTGIR